MSIFTYMGTTVYIIKGWARTVSYSLNRPEGERVGREGSRERKVTLSRSHQTVKWQIWG